MQAFQFISMQEPRLTARLAASAPPGTAIVLDLEDALWDVTDEARTADLKAGGRRDLLALAADHRDLFERARIGIRLNRWSSAEAALDLDALAHASRTVAFDAIVVTKVESAADLDGWARELQRRGVRCRTLVPIVETLAGIDRLDDIAAGARRLGLEWLLYGHYDYSLDAGWWPLPEHDEPRFWAHVEPLIERIERLGLNYIHPPFFGLTDMSRFGAILGHLAATCSRPFGAITLGRQQTALAAEPLRPSGSTDWLRDRTFDDADSLAARTVDAFLANRREGLSFAVDVSRGAFISPHLYLAARTHLAGLVRA